jgi:hypothetical protein
MQPFRVYKVSCLLLQVDMLGLAGFIYISFEWATSLADSGYAKSKDPMGRLLINVQHTFSCTSARLNLCATNLVKTVRELDSVHDVAHLLPLDLFMGYKHHTRG